MISCIWSNSHDYIAITDTVWAKCRPCTPACMSGIQEPAQNNVSKV